MGGTTCKPGTGGIPTRVGCVGKRMRERLACFWVITGGLSSDRGAFDPIGTLYMVLIGLRLGAWKTGSAQFVVGMLGAGAGSAGSYVIVWVWPWYWYWYRVVAVRPDGFFLAAMRTLVENDRCMAPSAKNKRRWSEDGEPCEIFAILVRALCVVATSTLATSATMSNSTGESATTQQLGDWVESLLAQVEKRFAEQNQQVVKRMNEMADRIDALESSILELVHGSEAKPAPAA